MSQITLQQRIRRLSFADKLAELAKSSPDLFTKEQTYRAVNAIRRDAGFSDDEKKRWILKLLAHGCSTSKDLINESGIPAPDMSRLLRELAESHKLRLTPMRGHTGGRPAQFIELVAA